MNNNNNIIYTSGRLSDSRIRKLFDPRISPSGTTQTSFRFDPRPLAASYRRRNARSGIYQTPKRRRGTGARPRSHERLASLYTRRPCATRPFTVIAIETTAVGSRAAKWF